MIGSAVLLSAAPAAASASPDAGVAPAPATGADAGIALKFAALLGGLSRRVAATSGEAAAEPAAADAELAALAEASDVHDPTVPQAAAAQPDADLAALRAFVLSVAQPTTGTPSPQPMATASAASPEVTIAPDAEVELSAAAGAADLRPVRDLALLHPRLRIRVERVISRMASEHGHDVRVIETLRSQARQDHLHAQGRTRPGDIVTWTTHSKHTEGMAADLVVVGGWSDPVAYERLQRIAREEGLATLGARDPGHVELKRPAQESAARGQLPADLRAAVSTSDFARPRGVGARARVAAVAAVAELARVAPVAEPARTAPVAAAAPTSPTAPTAPTAPAAPRPAREASDDAPGTEVKSEGTQGRGSGHTDFAVPPRPEARIVATASPATAPNAPLAASDRAERAEKIEQMLDLRASRPLQSLTLRVADADGTDHRIRVDLRGGQVAADIALADPARVSPLLSRLPELAQRLSDRGYDAGALQVRTFATESAPTGPLADPRTSSEDRPQHSGQQHHHSQSRHRGRRDPGGEAQ